MLGWIGERFRPGQRLSAADLNRLMDAVEAVASITAVAPLSVSWEGGRPVVRDQSRGVEVDLVRCVVTGCAAPAGVGSPASVVLYDVAGVRRPGVELRGAAPDYGRVVPRDQWSYVNVVPAPLGSMAWVLRQRDGEGSVRERLAVMGETLDFVRCTP